MLLFKSESRANIVEKLPLVRYSYTVIFMPWFLLQKLAFFLTSSSINLAKTKQTLIYLVCKKIQCLVALSLMILSAAINQQKLDLLKTLGTNW